MAIEDFLSPNDALFHLRAADKASLLTELSKRAAAALGLDVAVVCSELMKREDLGSTGVGAGIAIPHACLPSLTHPFGILARLSKAIDFGSIDGAPVDVVFLILLPTTSSGDQLNALASVTRNLRDPARASAVRRASSGVQLYEAITAQ
jgi:nitrogen PTS system EIIA component